MSELEHEDRGPIEKGRHHADTMMQEHVDFEWEEVDRNVFGKDSSEDVLDAAAQVVRKMMLFCWGDCRIRGSAAEDTWNAAFRKFTVLSLMLDARLLAGRGSPPNYRQLAGLLGCTKAAVSKILRAASTAFGGAHVMQRSDTGRQHMREAQLRRAEQKQLAECTAKGVPNDDATT